MCQGRRYNEKKKKKNRDMTTEAEVGVMPWLEGDHEPRNTSSQYKPKKARTGFSS